MGVRDEGPRREARARHGGRQGYRQGRRRQAGGPRCAHPPQLLPFARSGQADESRARGRRGGCRPGARLRRAEGAGCPDVRGDRREVRLPRHPDQQRSRGSPRTGLRGRRGGLRARPRHEPQGQLLVRAGSGPAHGPARRRLHREPLLDRCRSGAGELRRGRDLQGRARGAHPVSRRRVRAPEHPRQHGLVHPGRGRRRAPLPGLRRGDRDHDRLDAARSTRDGRRSRRPDRFPHLGPVALHDRADGARGRRALARQRHDVAALEDTPCRAPGAARRSGDRTGRCSGPRGGARGVRRPGDRRDGIGRSRSEQPGGVLADPDRGPGSLPGRAGGALGFAVVLLR